MVEPYNLELIKDLCYYVNVKNKGTKDMEKAGKNFRPEPLQESDFYFFKGYLIRVSKNGKDIWVYNKRSYQSNFRGEKALEKGMDEVYRLIELEEQSRKEQQEKAQREEQAREKLKPYMDYIIKELA